MKNLYRTFYLGILTIFVACNSNNSNNKAENKMPETGSMQITKPDQKFANIQFASKRDTTCGMPISAGLVDTLILNGKTYGFCAAECKDEFITVLKKQNKR